MVLNGIGGLRGLAVERSSSAGFAGFELIRDEVVEVRGSTIAIHFAAALRSTDGEAWARLRCSQA